jgi:hypothetical protein
MKAELAQYLVDRLGVDLTSVDGLVVYLTSFDEKQAALFVRLRTMKPFKWKSAPAGQHHGVDLVAVAPKLFSASVPGGLVLGTIETVKAAIDRGGEAFAPLRPKIPQAMNPCSSSSTNFGSVRPLAGSVHSCSKVRRCCCNTL